MTPRQRDALAVAAGMVGAAVVVTMIGRGQRAPADAELVQVVDGDDLEVVALTAEPQHVLPGQVVQLRVAVEHGRGAPGPLRYRWRVPSGVLSADDAAAVTWTAPAKPGRRTVRVVVEDGEHSVDAKVAVEVRLPSARQQASLRGVMDDIRREEQDAAAARMAAIDRQLARLEAVVARRDTVSDLLAGQMALAEMAELLTDAGRYEEARAVWDRLLDNMLTGDSKYARYQARLGNVLFMLGDDDAALAAWRAGDGHTSSMSHYYRGEILERRGDRAGALAAYAQAQEGLHWFGDTVYRRALLMLEDGADPAEVADLLVAASPRLDREHMLARFADDPETAVLGALLRDTGRVHDLVAQQPLIIETSQPQEQQQ